MQKILISENHTGYGTFVAVVGEVDPDGLGTNNDPVTPSCSVGVLADESVGFLPQTHAARAYRSNPP